ncbi:phage integrase SAM-like domain-containing protein [Terasakiella sp. SH-1]|uniref:tyrosine-type recombinase/integrase n=1 Tax=Terasakiella sp. SH-1 TaxID=2560057 RepID=UPI001073FD37|nr:phage integrase SAM-like domain-containing protein [Terasakiella sp. SH-1]
MAKHEIMGGKVHVYKRDNSKYWQCSTYLLGKNHRTSTKEESLAQAKDFAEDWYLGLRGKAKTGNLKNEKLFKQAAEQFTREYEVLTNGERNAKYVQDHQARLRNHLIPFFGNYGLSEVTAGAVQDYRIFRMENPERPPSRSTMHHEIVTLRQVLKTAIRHDWLQNLPDLSMPYKASGKVTHRAWFSPEEYKRLYEATREHAKKGQGKPWQWAAEQLHDYILFMANTGLRPDEIKRIQYRDVEIIDDEDTDETILLIEVRGKRGVGYCKSMVGAVRPFERLIERNNPRGDDLVFPADHKKQFNNILEKEGLKFDRDGSRRTAYSLRHSYICFRLMDGADVYQIAKNCRTSVEMIEKHYAAHIKNSINASAINVKRKRKKVVKPKKRPRARS